MPMLPCILHLPGYLLPLCIDLRHLQGMLQRRRDLRVSPFCPLVSVTTTSPSILDFPPKSCPSYHGVSQSEEPKSAGGTHKAVRMYPGLIQLTRIPSPAHSTAKLAAICLTAALDALYGACGWGTLTTTLLME